MIVAIGGEPACGKSTLVKKFVQGLGGGKAFTSTTKIKVKGHVFEDKKVAVLGRYDGSAAFEGTDQFSMAVSPCALEVLQFFDRKGYGVVYEGDRLFSEGFFRAMDTMPLKYALMVLQADEETKRQRHIDRADTQTETWLKGRKTKIENILRARPMTTVLPNNNEADQQRALETLRLQFWLA